MKKKDNPSSPCHLCDKTRLYELCQGNTKMANEKNIEKGESVIPNGSSFLYWRKLFFFFFLQSL